MKKLLSLLFVIIILFSLCSCGDNDSKIMDDLSASLTPPLKMRIIITADNITSEANVSFHSPNLEVTMSIDFVSPSIISGLKVERHKDGRLFADYEGVISEVDDKALNIVSASCDVLQLIRDDLSTYGTIVESIDERYGQIEMSVNDASLTVFFDKETNTVLRITSNLFDIPVRIDIIDLEHIETSINDNVSEI